MKLTKSRFSESVKKHIKKLDSIMQNCKEALIVVHNDPDPDALATAAAMHHLLIERYSVSVSIAYGGDIARAENKALLRELNIKLKQINRISFDKYERIATVDTQPGAGNNSLNKDIKTDIVVDHHPHQKNVTGDLVVIEPKIGVTATILIEWLKECEVEIPTHLATGLSYAISSETQNMGREASIIDIDAYLHVFVKASMKRLAKIINPKRPQSYYEMVAKALHRAMNIRNLVCVHLGNVSNVEIVAEMADFFMGRENISWTLCTGRFKTQLVLSLRTSNNQKKANTILTQIVPDTRNVGGHDMIAGGRLDLSDNKYKAEEAEKELSRNFAELFDYNMSDWSPLLESLTFTVDVKE